MVKSKVIPVIDLFAGPGGLGEGFSSLYKKNKRFFEIKLSIEKDVNAHETLQLRSFFRQFDEGEAPSEYYEMLQEGDIKKRKELRELLFKKYPEEYQIAKEEAWHAELGGENFSSALVDKRISKGLGGVKEWLLIGGPPCQAYSLVGRSRVGGVKEGDHRIYLYKEYLRIIAKYHPTVFVMENVKGLLSAEVNGKSVFDSILNDLSNPSSVFKDYDSPSYKIYSLVEQPDEDLFENVAYSNKKDFLIKAENYGVPQRRHRVILLGVREDVAAVPTTLVNREIPVTLKNVIDDLPRLRSGISRMKVKRSITEKDQKKKVVYKKVTDSKDNWEKKVNLFQRQLLKNDVLSSQIKSEVIKSSNYDLGGEFIAYETPSEENPLKEWYQDKRLAGVCNHESRTHLLMDLKRYLFSALFTKVKDKFPRMHDYQEWAPDLLPDHKNVKSGKFADRFRVQLPNQPATTITSHISKDGHYFIHYDYTQCRSFTVREAARVQTFPDNYLFCGSRTAQFHQVGNAVPPYLANQIAEVVYNVFCSYDNHERVIEKNKDKDRETVFSKSDINGLASR